MSFSLRFCLCACIISSCGASRWKPSVMHTWWCQVCQWGTVNCMPVRSPACLWLYWRQFTPFESVIAPTSSYACASASTAVRVQGSQRKVKVFNGDLLYALLYALLSSLLVVGRLMGSMDWQWCVCVCFVVFRPCVCRGSWSEDATVLFVWRYGQHSFTYGIQWRRWGAKQQHKQTLLAMHAFVA